MSLWTTTELDASAAPSTSSEQVPAGQPQNIWLLSAFVFIVAAATTTLLGKDLSWDLYNYHLYAPHAALNYHLNEDFMGAGWLKYINPYAAVPFYLMVMAGLPAIVISILLSSLHAVNVLLVWCIGWQLLRCTGDSRDLVTLATVLGVSTTVFIGLVGSTFTDPIVSVFVLASLVLLLQYAQNPTKLRYVGVSGALVGIATGLKLTNGIFAIAIFAASMTIGGTARNRFKLTLLVGSFILIGVLASTGWWSFQLFKEFGNPIFPLQNSLFRSPDFPTISLHNERFVGSFLETLTLAVRMIQHKTWLYYEITAPDIRIPAIIGLIAFGVCRLVGRARHGLYVGAVVEMSPTEKVFWTFFIVGFTLWAITSSNARYGLAIMLLAGPALASAAAKVVHSSRVVVGLLLVLLSAQIVMLAHVGNPRWSSTDWTYNWLEYDIPPVLKNSPHGYLALGTNSLSSVIPLLHGDSRIVSLTGIYAIDPSGPGAHRVHNFISRHRSQLRMLAPTPLNRAPPDRQFPLSAHLQRKYDQELAPWGLSIDASSCLQIVEDRSSIDISASATGGLLTCAVVEGNALSKDIEARRRQIDPAFDRLEAACPSLFRPKGVYSVLQGTMWTRRYFDTDTVLFSQAGQMRYSRYEYGPFDVDLGPISDALKGRIPDACSASQPTKK